MRYDLIPVPSEELVEQQYRAFEALKTKLLDKDDYVTFKRRGGGDHVTITRQGWRKLATALNISVTTEAEQRHEIPGGFAWTFTLRAAAPNGRAFDGVGACTSTERPFTHPEHDVRATAYTRAANRAIADLIGGGELSAEEIEEQPAPATRVLPNHLVASATWAQFKEQALKRGWTLDFDEVVIWLQMTGGDLRAVWRLLQEQNDE